MEQLFSAEEMAVLRRASEILRRADGQIEDSYSYLRIFGLEDQLDVGGDLYHKVEDFLDLADLIDMVADSAK